MNQFRPQFFAAILTTILLFACGQTDLTRTEAKTLLERSSNLSQYKTTLPLHASALDLGAQMGFWKPRGGGGFDPKEFNPNLGNEFVEIRGGGFMRDFDVIEVSKSTSSNISLEIEVTGISGDTKSDTRRIEFAWRYTNLPRHSKFVAVEGGQGIAEARIYDDGWRISENISVTASKTPFRLTQEEDTYKLSTIANLVAEKRSAAEARAKKIADFNDLVMKARISNDIQQVLSFAGSPSWCCQERVVATIYNGGLTVERIEIRKNGEERSWSKQSVYFSDIDRAENSLPIVAGFMNGAMYLGGMQVVREASYDLGKSEEHLAAINAVNRTFEKWLQNSGLHGRCPNSKKWGCNRLVG